MRVRKDRSKPHNRAQQKGEEKKKGKKER